MKSRLSMVLHWLVPFTLLGVLGLVSPGCTLVDNNGHADFAVQVAVTQGVVRFVEAGESPVARAYRKESLISALSIARVYVDSGEPLDVLNWSDEFIRLMDWDAVSVADQLLLMQLIGFVRIELDARVGDSATRIYLGRVIDLAINVAKEV
jgi:hypothetical protein